MKLFAYITLFITGLLLSVFAYAQQNKIDSLKKVLLSAKEDTNRVNALNELGRELMYSNPDTAIRLSNQALAILTRSEAKNLSETIKQKLLANTYANLGAYYYLKADYPNALKNYFAALRIDEKLNNMEGIASHLSKIGIVYKNQADYPKALEFYFKALKITEELENKNGIATTLGNIGNVYKEQADYPKALEYYFKSLKIKEELENKNGIATTLGNIGSVYLSQAVYIKALEYYFKALKMAEELGDRNLIAIQLGNIGSVYLSQANSHNVHPVERDSLLNRALDYYFKSLKMSEELGNKNGIATTLGNIGIVYYSQADYTKALEYYFKALKMSEELGYKKLQAFALGNIGSLYTKKGKFAEAEKYLKHSLELSDSLGNLEGEKETNQYLSHLYDTLSQLAVGSGQWAKKAEYSKLAFEHYKKYIAARDSINSEENQKKQVRIEMNYEFEKKMAAEKAEQEKRELKAREEAKKQRIILFSVSVFLLLVIVFAVFVVRSLKNTRRQKAIIETQKKIVEEKNKDIMDSIRYAQRIQNAILPNPQEWIRLLPDSFVLYLPKDIVAGDFYFLEETDKYIFVAAADCTGHGVPGAMVSVVCSTALTRCIREEHIYHTQHILNRTRQIVIEKLSGEDNLQDGMDICLVRIKKGTYNIQYSGANRPLWIINPQGEYIEIKPDKQPIGKYEQEKPFTLHELSIEKDSLIYLSTDGYADQFGGEKNKKMGVKMLKELLLSISNKPPKEQEAEIAAFFQNWKNNIEQVDDVTLIGIKIS